MKRLRRVILAGVLVTGCCTAEYLSRRRVDPTGRATTLSEYLVWRRSADRFAAADVDGRLHVIAYGPASSWLLLSSGPSAYVFDDAGRLVDWSPDIGDDPTFNRRWDAQVARGVALPLSRGEVERIAAPRKA